MPVLVGSSCELLIQLIDKNIISMENLSVKKYPQIKYLFYIKIPKSRKYKNKEVIHENKTYSYDNPDYTYFIHFM